MHILKIICVYYYLSAYPQNSPWLIHPFTLSLSFTFSLSISLFHNTLKYSCITNVQIQRQSCFSCVLIILLWHFPFPSISLFLSLSLSLRINISIKNFGFIFTLMHYVCAPNTCQMHKHTDKHTHAHSNTHTHISQPFLLLFRCRHVMPSHFFLTHFCLCPPSHHLTISATSTSYAAGWLLLFWPSANVMRPSMKDPLQITL